MSLTCGLGRLCFERAIQCDCADGESETISNRYAGNVARAHRYSNLLLGPGGEEMKPDLSQLSFIEE